MTSQTPVDIMELNLRSLMSHTRGKRGSIDYSQSDVLSGRLYWTRKDGVYNVVDLKMILNVIDNNKI